MSDPEAYLSARCIICNHHLLPNSCVPVSNLNLENLSKWWINFISSEYNEANFQGRKVCNSCIADARYYHENQKGTNNPDQIWWPVVTKKEFEEPSDTLSSTDWKMQPVVVMRKLSDEEIWRAISNPEDSKFHIRRSKRLKKDIKEAAKVDLRITEGMREKKYKCRFCPSMFTSVNWKECHEKKIHQQGVKTEDPDELELQADSKNRCHHCRVNFADQMSLAEHTKEKHPVIDKSAKHQCPFCIFKMANRKSLLTHIHAVHPAMIFRCPSGCPGVLLGKDEYQNHLKQVHNVDELLVTTVRCPFRTCHKIFQDEEQMDQHYQNTHQKKKGVFKCKICGYRGPERSYVSFHVKKYHPEVEKEAAMDISESVALPTKFEPVDLKPEAILVAETEREPDEFRCPLCKEEMALKFMKGHRKRAVCNYCRKLFACAGMLYNHTYEGCRAVPEMSLDGYVKVAHISIPL